MNRSQVIDAWNFLKISFCFAGIFTTISRIVSLAAKGLIKFAMGAYDLIVTVVTEFMDGLLNPDEPIAVTYEERVSSLLDIVDMQQSR